MERTLLVDIYYHTLRITYFETERQRENKNYGKLNEKRLYALDLYLQGKIIPVL